LSCRLDRRDQDRSSEPTFAFPAEGDQSAIEDDEKVRHDAECVVRFFMEPLSLGCIAFREAAERPPAPTAEVSVPRA